MCPVHLVITRSPLARQRRRAPRLPMRLAGRVAGRVPHRVIVVDLSLTGCLVQCDVLLVHGAILDLEIEIGEPTLGAKVKVAASYLDGSATEEAPLYLAGLEFLALTPQAADRLRRLLEGERRRRKSADSPAR